MLRIINFEDSPTADPSSDNIKFPNSSGLPILDLETPFNKERLCKYCRYGDSALNHIIWVCCCDGYNRFAHESCLKTAVFYSIKAVTSDASDNDTESWRRCSQCCVLYRIEFNKRSRPSCEKLKYNIVEHTAYVVLTLIVMLVLFGGLIALILTTAKTVLVLPDYTDKIMIGLYVGIAVQTIAIIILNVVFFKAHFLLPELTVARIHGIDECVPEQELGLENQNIVQLDLNGEKKLVFHRNQA